MSHNETAGIILAAGRGSRMKDLTSEHPKCLLRLAGRPLLDWQTEAMKIAGIDRLLVVRGYKKECLNGCFDTVDNDNWENTNMLSSLLCAKDFAQEFFANGGKKLLVSYSDIVWRPGHAQKLLESQSNIAMTYDTLWESLWRLRFADPLSDAETFLQKDGQLLEIGCKTDDISRIHGQYMGLLCFDEQGWQTLLDFAGKLGAKTAKTDMTAFFRMLLERQIPVGTVPVEGGWCECDSGEDLAKYETALSDENWSHDWRKKD